MKQQTPAPLRADEAIAIATDAYIFGYPLLTMEMTRRVTTNVTALQGLHAPMGQSASARTYPTAAFRDVTAPNADTLYSSAWLDLSKEPYVLSLPDAQGRYYLFPMLERVDDGIPGPGHTNYRHRRTKLCNYRPALVGQSPRRCNRVQIAN
jgi:hypothetical protein